MPSEFISVKRVVFVSTLTGLCWLALTDNRGWWFFFALWLAILYWQYVNQLNLPPIRWHRLPGFLMFFSKQLVLGAFDVAWRALAIKPNIAPQWQWYPVRLSQPASRQLLASLISLLPGTCSAQVQHHRQRTNQLLLHVLDQHTDWRKSVAALEQQLAGLLYLEHVAEVRS